MTGRPYLDSPNRHFDDAKWPKRDGILGDRPMQCAIVNEVRGPSPLRRQISRTFAAQEPCLVDSLLPHRQFVGGLRETADP
jgi:hypothetical protein